MHYFAIAFYLVYVYRMQMSQGCSLWFTFQRTSGVIFDSLQKIVFVVDFLDCNITPD